MSEEDKKELKKIIASAMAYYRHTIDHMVIAMYAEDLKDFDLFSISQAYNHWRRNPKNKTMPLPAHIREIIAGPTETSDITKAREISARIIASVSKFGYINGYQAKEYIGEIGWRIVEMHGGWNYICEHLGENLNQNQCEAQWRDHALSIIESAKAGMLDDKLELPERQIQMIHGFKEIFKIMGKNLNEEIK